MAESVLSLQDLRVSFKTAHGQVNAVRGVSLEVEPGECVGIVGESGSGKSVTFLATMGLLPPRTQIAGKALVKGRDLIGIKRSTLDTIRGKEIAMIFQDPLSALDPVYKIGDQIVEMINSHQSISKAAAQARAVELLDMVGIPQPDQRAKQYPHEFSGGMRQRVMIAMAIANDPSVLIADEPTTALDVTVQSQILDLLERVRREMNTAVVIITHDLGVVARVADKVQVMYAGRPVERTKSDMLFSKPTHPYTEGLLNSIPHEGLERLIPVPGSPPNMLKPPSGCAFRPRCNYAGSVCADKIPDLKPHGASETACVRIDDIKLEGVL